MTAERSQLYYTCVFLHVSFQAIQNSMAVLPNRDDTPCWLDTHMLRMLLSELQRCHQTATPFKKVSQPLETAIYHCGLLLAQCPSALNRQLCQHHLRAIMSPLKEATEQLSGNANYASANGVPSPGRRLRSWLRW